MAFPLVLCNHGVTVDAFTFLPMDIDYMLINETIMREQGREGALSFLVLSLCLQWLLVASLLQVWLCH